MKRHKSKSNIMNNDKQTQKFLALMKKQKHKNQTGHKSTAKLGQYTKKIQAKPIYPQKSTNMHSKTKSYLQKMTIILPQKNQIQPFSTTQRKKSVSVMSQKITDGRLSKRGSVASNKSTKDKKTENMKENDKNHLNLEQVEEHQNQQLGTQSKKNIKKLLNKKKLSLNLNSKTKIQHGAYESQRKFGDKSQNYQQFENKMSQYLNSKDIFSRKVSQQKSNHSKQSKKSSSQKKITQKEKKLHPQKTSEKIKNKEKQNLLGIYQFYKKTFDINFNNCFKRCKSSAKIDKNSQNNSKSALKPCYQSIVVQKNENSNIKNEMKPFFQTNNQTKISISGILNQNDENNKAKRSGRISVCDKENESKIKFQKSQFINSRSKSNINSESSTKDNLMYWKSQQQNIDQNIMNTKRQKRSFKDLIVFNDKFERNSHLKQDLTHEIFESNNKKQVQEECTEFSKISIGQSNIEVLKWSCIEEKQLNQDKDKGKNHLIKEEKYNSGNLIEKQSSVCVQKGMQNIPQNSCQKVKNVHSSLIVKSVIIPQVQEQVLDVTKLIKRHSKQSQIGNLDDLSSISLTKDAKDGISQNPFSASPNKGLKLLQIQDIEFQL